MPDVSFLDFALFILPGYIALSIFRKVYPTKQKGELHLAVWSVVWSGLFVLILSEFDRRWFAGHLETSAFFGGDERPATRALVGLLLVALVAGGLLVFQVRLRNFASKKVAWLEWLGPDQMSVWAKLNARDDRSWCVVYLNDGASYLGWIHTFSADPEQTDQEFFLARAKRVRDDLSVMYSVDGPGVYLSTKGVTRIEFVRGQSSP